jgi:hypothetical protein
LKAFVIAAAVAFAGTQSSRCRPPVEDAKALLTYDLDGRLKSYPVSRDVNSSRGVTEGRVLIEPVA